MLFEVTGLGTVVTALRALVWFFSGVDAEVGFQASCVGQSSYYSINGGKVDLIL